jgi:hypothetical protein
MKTLKTTLTNLIIYPKAYPKFLKVILLLICILFFDNCRRRDECEGSPKSNYNYDSTHFDSSEQSKIPDWQGDSLYFYSDAGDTAYMFCSGQTSQFSYEYDKGGAYLPCPYDLWSWYPSVYYYYQSNEPTLNGLQIHIYKESNGSKWDPNGPPVARFLVPGLDGYRLSEFGDKVIPTDSVKIENGLWEFGWNNRDKNTTISLKIGFLRINFDSGKKWTLFKYKLNN